jgi:hypothetical protein
VIQSTKKSTKASLAVPAKKNPVTKQVAAQPKKTATVPKPRTAKAVAPVAPQRRASGSAATKTEKILALLQRPGGTTIAAVMKATGWQAHSVRAFLSATIGKRMGLTVTSTLRDNGERAYMIERE